jgi:hypothetical protein
LPLNLQTKNLNASISGNGNMTLSNSGTLSLGEISIYSGNISIANSGNILQIPLTSVVAGQGGSETQASNIFITSNTGSIGTANSYLSVGAGSSGALTLNAPEGGIYVTSIGTTTVTGAAKTDFSITTTSDVASTLTLTNVSAGNLLAKVLFGQLILSGEISSGVGAKLSVTSPILVNGSAAMEFTGGTTIASGGRAQIWLGTLVNPDNSTLTRVDLFPPFSIAKGSTVKIADPSDIQSIGPNSLTGAIDINPNGLGTIQFDGGVSITTPISFQRNIVETISP